MAVIKLRCLLLLLPGVLLSAVLDVPVEDGVPERSDAPVAERPCLRVWNADPTEPVAPDAWRPIPDAELRPVRLVAPRNGVGSGQVVVQCVGCRVTGVGTSALRSEAGVELDGERVRIRYAVREDGPYCDTLAEAPSEGARVLPIWLIVEVPRDQASGKYGGKLTIRAGEQAFVVPVELEVCAWIAPDPSNNVSHVSLLHSPDTLAARYGVEPWSDGHFALIEKSLALMGQVGNDVLYAPVVRYTHLGNNNGMIRWVEKGNPSPGPAGAGPASPTRGEAGERSPPSLPGGGAGISSPPSPPGGGADISSPPSPLGGEGRGEGVVSSYTPDLSVFDRFLDLYAKHCGPPKVLCLEVWNHRIREGEAPLVTRYDPGTGALAELAAPSCGAAGSAEFWKPMMDAARAAVRGRGWDERCLMIGAAADRWPSKATVDFYRRVAPYARWAIFTHGRWKGTRADDDAGRMFVANGMEIGYHEDPWGYGDAKLVGEVDFKPWRRQYVKAGSLRECVSEWAHPVRFRNLADIAVNRGNQGFGRVGLDYWPVDGQPLIGLHENKGWDRLYSDNPRAVAAPGPDGPLPTVRFQMLREGVQEAEARIVIAAALEREEVSGALGADLAGRCRALLEERRALREAAKDEPGAQAGGGWLGMTARLCALAAEVAAAAR